MKRSGIRRRSRLLSGGVVRKASRRRSGLSAEERDELKHLHIRAVMLRASAAEVWESPDGRRLRWPIWWGNCEHCGKACFLATCHIEPQGQFPNLKYDPENAWAGCYRCHIHWWHKNPREAQEWITQRLGPKREPLAMRARTRQQVDWALVRLVLDLEIRRLEKP